MTEADLKNGFTRIANEILESLIKARLRVYPRAIVDAIIRETFGWKLSKRQVSIGRISYLTKIPSWRVSQEIKKLLDAKIIYKQETKGIQSINIYGLNRHCTEWKIQGINPPVSINPPVVRGINSPVVRGINSPVETLPLTERKIKETLNKHNNILCNQTFKTLNKWLTQMNNGKDMASLSHNTFRKYGEERIKKALGAIDRAYNPSLSTFWDALLGKKR